MSDYKYHISVDGEPVVCYAKIKCRLGGESGKENHFETKEEARAAYENSMESNNFISHGRRVTVLPNPSDLAPSMFEGTQEEQDKRREDEARRIAIEFEENKRMKEILYQDGKYVFNDEIFKDMNDKERTVLLRNVDDDLFKAGLIPTTYAAKVKFKYESLSENSRSFLLTRDRLAKTLGKRSIEKEVADDLFESSQENRNSINDTKELREFEVNKAVRFNSNRNWVRHYNEELLGFYGEIHDLQPKEHLEILALKTQNAEIDVEEIQLKLKKIGDPSIFKIRLNREKADLEEQYQSSLKTLDSLMKDLSKFKKDNKL